MTQEDAPSHLKYRSKPAVARDKEAYIKQLRLRATPAELLVFDYLDSSRCYDWPYVEFQSFILGYIVDFYFREAQTVLEVDGSYHADTEVYDSTRDQHMLREGYRVFRVTNDAVMADVATALMPLWRRFDKLGLIYPHRRPGPQRIVDCVLEDWYVKRNMQPAQIRKPMKLRKMVPRARKLRR